jgi:ABC-2 type transport system permease protein
MYLLKAGKAVPSYITFLIGSMIFWDILYRAQQGVTISFLEDVWARNLLNLFVAPIRVSEFIVATYIVGFVKIIMIVALLTVMASSLYSFNLFAMGISLIPLFVNLLLMGWAVGMIATAMIVRLGQSAEALAWGIPFMIQPLCAVFYPLSILPKWLQPISLAIPATHVFEGMRQVLENKGMPVGHLWAAFGLNLVYLAVAALIFNRMFNVARRKGLLAKLGTQ